MQTASYFTTYYLELKLGYIFVATNYLIAAGIPLLLCRYQWKDTGSLLKLLGKVALSCAGMELMGVILHYARSNVAVLPYVGGAVLLILFVLFSRNYPLIQRITMAVAYAGMFATALGTCLAVGHVRQTEDFILQRILMVLSVFLMLGLTLLYRGIAGIGLPDWKPAIPVVLVGGLSYAFGCCFFWFKLLPSTNLAANLLLLIVLTVVYYTAFSIGGWMQNQNRQRAERLLRQADENMLAVLKENLEAYNRIRHDTRNHCLYMQTLLEQGDYGRLGAYLSDYAQETLGSFSAISCANQTISAILNLEDGRARRAGAHLCAELMVPEEMAFSDTDLCSLLLNLIDNAAEYLDAHRELPERRIDVQIRLVRRMLLITVKNMIQAQDARNALGLHTSKRDKELHGYGSKIVETIVRSYNGVVRYQVVDGWFEVSVMLAEPKEEAEEC